VRSPKQISDVLYPKQISDVLYPKQISDVLYPKQISDVLFEKLYAHLMTPIKRWLAISLRRVDIIIAHLLWLLPENNQLTQSFSSPSFLSLSPSFKIHLNEPTQSSILKIACYDGN
jgi:hypothetical protein